MKNEKMADSTSERTKVFLAEYGIATVGLDTERENLRLGLVEAPDKDAALELAIREHCWEGFDEDENGQLNGEWIEYQGHRAFQLSEDQCDVDANSIYWVNNIVEIPDEDAVVLRKYLGAAVSAETFDNAIFP